MTASDRTLPAASAATVDQDEIARFGAIAAEWWDPKGKFRPLHQLNPLRLAFIRRRLCQQFDRDERSSRAAEALDVLDIGCGGGLLSEPMTRQGGRVKGIDPSEDTIAVARAHARQVGLDIAYEATTVERIAERGDRYDVVLAMEVVEHVPDLNTFVTACAALIRPGGLFIGSTINRTMKAYVLAILGAERVLRWLPAGTHRYEKLVTPAEFTTALADCGLSATETAGMVYNPLSGSWHLSADLDVNYLICAAKPRS